MEKAGSKYLIFFAHGRRYALDLAQVAEVADPPFLWPIPLAPHYYAGAMNFHGAIVAVMELACFMGQPGCQELEKVVVLDPQIAALAFQVERVTRIVAAAEVEHLPSPELPFASGLLLLAEGEATLLDAAELAREAARRING